MFVTRITPDYNLNIPDDFRKMLPVGQEVALSVDTHGRLVVTPIEQIREVLMESFGMWADRTDLPAESVDYVDEIRRGDRLDDTGVRGDETH